MAYYLATHLEPTKYAEYIDISLIIIGLLAFYYITYKFVFGKR